MLVITALVFVAEKLSGAGQDKVAVSAPTLSAAPSAAEQATFVSDAQRLFGLMKGCDDAAAGAMAAMKSRNAYDEYDAVTAAQGACNSAQADIATFTFSNTIASSRRDLLTPVLAQCAQAYGAKALALQEVAVVVNGDTSPQAVDGAKGGAGEAAAQVSVCVVSLLSSATKAGFSVDALVPKDDGKAD